MVAVAIDGFTALPASAAWRHRESRDGFESVFLHAGRSGYRLEGHTAAVEQGRVWAVRYTIVLDEKWTTRSAAAWGWSVAGPSELRIVGDGSGRWRVNGSPAPALDGCLDVDFEASACTNMVPVRRLRLRVGQSAEAPATWVRAPDLGVDRLEQRYVRADDDGPHQRYDYRAPSVGFECRLVYDEAGLVLEYPGIATRVR